MLSAQNNLQNTNNRANPSEAESGLVALLSAELWSQNPLSSWIITTKWTWNLYISGPDPLKYHFH